MNTNNISKTPGKSVIILVAGSLRKGGLNHKVYLEGKSEFMGLIRTNPEFSMYNAGHTAIISKGTTSLLCEAYKIRQNSVLQKIMKLCHWNEVKVVKIPVGTKAFLFWNPDYKGNKKELVLDGNWTNRPLLNKFRYEQVR